MARLIIHGFLRSHLTLDLLPNTYMARTRSPRV